MLALGRHSQTQADTHSNSLAAEDKNRNALHAAKSFKAVFSLTGPNEEVTFEDILNGTGEVKPGYEKIRFCGEQAKQDGLLYFWIDTCCINKSNDAELSRSINYMFRWYRNAARCYVYLSDVSGCSVSGNHKCISRLWESDFRKSKWFTRGWTLQELLAPVSVEFFSRERGRLALEGHPLSQFSVEERLQWIQHRQTTLEEDKAYSLLGIFDVYILPIYKEGLASAHARLLDEFYKKQKCIQDLRLSDPRDDKKRIEDTKGGLLEGLYDWILGNPDFQRWRKDQQSRLLWIKGDPGKGKTMLLCGVINELEKSKAKSVLLSHFFCQATDSRINYATAVLRGLIYLLVDQQRSLISHIRTKYDESGKSLFEDANAWVVLSKIFIDILQDPSLDFVYLIVDALDECVVDLPKLMDLIVQTSSISPRIKWIVSSRNWPNIEEALDTPTQKLRLCLELNEKSISAAVATFIQLKVNRLATRNKYSNDTREAIQQHLTINANGTFLWVALICQELSNIPRLKALQKLTAFPPGLDALYRRMLDQITDAEDAELYISILAVVSAVYRPVTLDELVALVDMPDGVASDYEALSEIIGFCGSFLTLRERTIFFVHQSAKDFLIKKTSKDMFLPTKENVHSRIFSRSLQAMSPTLRRDIYDLRAPGISIDQVKPPVPDPLATVRYSCLYWVDHLFECDAEGIIYNNLKDNGSVHNFLRQSFLCWFEALSLMRCLPNGIVIIRKLENLVQLIK
ncbi:vegetative incompatibility protein het-e-1 [Botrytis cinerea]